MTSIWKAPEQIRALVEDVKMRNHHPRLEAASIAVCLQDSKAYTGNRLNWGRVLKFSDFNKIWHDRKYDFCIVLCADVWQAVLDDRQREALVDLHLTRCEVEYLPEVDGDGKPVKDELGKVAYSNEIKTDDDGTPKWKVAPLDLVVFTSNVRRYGLWCDDIEEFGEEARRAE